MDFDGSGFEWVDCQNAEDSVLVYLRKAKNPDDFLVVCCNFTPVVREDYPIGVPRGGWYQEVFNSDSSYYAGTNVGNHPGVNATEPGHHMRSHQIKVNLPPLGAVIFKPE